MKENLEDIKTEPILVSRFDDIRKKPEIRPALDDFRDIFSDEEIREHFFEEAKRSFEFILDKNKFREHIEREPNKKSFHYLKQVRRYGLIFKTLCRFVSSNHKCGENLNDFLFLLGEYNDNYWLNPAEEIKQNILANLDDLDFPVNFVDTLGFKEYVKTILAYMEEHLRKKTLSMKDFHTLRKEFRLFSNLMQVVAAENCGQEPHWLFYYLFKLSLELGKQHDDFVQKGLRGEIDYDKSVVRVNPQIADEFKRLKPYIEKVCGLDVA